MKITFIGGTETVTGSKFLLETDTTSVLVDCGLFQGYKWLRERNWQTLPLDIDKLDAVLLTHAHLDHSGYIPVLYKRGFRGPVFTHHATKALCQILLADSGHIQEEDARYYSKHKLGKHAHPEPLYDRQTAEASMTLFRQLAEIVNRVAKSGGVLLVPAFAVGRAQALQHLLASLMDQGDIPKMPAYLDSPMAIKVSDVFCQFSDQHRLNHEQCYRMCDAITYTRTVDESKAIAGQAFPHIVIAGSGMATGGRILHHFNLN